MNAIRRLALGAVAVGIIMIPAAKARSATACGSMITNMAEIAWESLNSVVVSGTSAIPSVIPSATAYVQVDGSLFTSVKRWFNLSRPGAPLPGDIVQFVVTVSNTGNTIPITGFKVVDTLPAGMTLVTTVGSATAMVNGTPVTSTSWTISNAAGTLTASQVGTVGVAPHWNVDFSYRALVNSFCTAVPITNTAWVGASDACMAAMLTATSFVPALPVITTSISKTHSPATPVNGGSMKYYIVVTNTGQATITSLKIVDTLPITVAYNSDTSTAGLAHTFAGQVHAWNGTLTTPLAPGMSASVVIDAFADNCWSGLVSNTAWVSASDSCARVNGGGSSYIDAFTLTPPAVAISMVKTTTPASPTNGGPVAYNIIVTNTGAATITSLRVTDTLPAQVTFGSQSSAPAMTWNTQTSVVSWYSNALTINPGQSATLTINGTASVCFTGNVSNTAFAVAGNGCATAYLSAQSSFALAAPPLTLNVTKTHTPAAPVNNGPVAYCISVTNTSLTTVTDLTVVDTVPSQVTFASEAHQAGLAFTNTAGVLTWTGSSLTFGPSQTWTMTLNGTASQCFAGFVSNTAYVMASSACGSTVYKAIDAGYTLVPPTVAMSVVKTHIPAAPVNGGGVTFKIYVTNTGTATLTSIKVSDTLTANVTYTAGSQASAPALGSFVQAGNNLFWEGALTLGPGASATVSFDGVNAACFAGVVSNTVWVSTGNACSSTQYKVLDSGYTLNNPGPSITVSKVAVPANPGNGNPVSYLITVTNTSVVTISDVKISDTLPAQFTYGGEAHPAGFTFVNNSPILSWNGALSFYPGTSLTVTLTGTTSICYTGNVSNTGWAVATNGCAVVQAAGQASYALAAPPIAMTVVKTSVPAAPANGAPVAYYITVNNTSTQATITNIVIVDTLSANITYGSESHTNAMAGLTFLNNAGVLSWTGALTLGPLASASVAVFGTTSLCFTGQVSNTAWVYAVNACDTDEQKSVTGFNLAAWTAGVSIVKTAVDMVAPAGISNGEEFLYRIQVTNTGSATITTVKIVDTLHPQVTFNAEYHNDPRLAALTFNGLSVSTTGVAAWNGTLALAPGASATIELFARTSDCFAGWVSNTAWIYAGTDCAAANAQAFDLEPGFNLTAPGPSLTLTKVAVPAAPANGAAVNYLIVVNNTGPVAITGVKIADTLPAGFTYAGVHDEPAGEGLTYALNGSVVSWNNAAANLAVGEIWTLTISGTAANCFVGNVSNTAWIYATAACGFDQRTARSDFTLVSPAVGITVNKTLLTPTPANGGPVSYRIDVTNTSLATVASLAITDTLAAVITYSSEEHPTTGTWNFNGAGQYRYWTATGLTMGPTQVMSVTITGTLQLCYSGWVSNTAWAMAAGVCGGESRAQALQNGFNLVQQTNSYTVAKTHTPASPANGMPVTYNIVITNNGTGTLTNLKVTDTIPAQFTYASEDHSQQATLAFSQAGSILSWVGAASIPPAGVFTITVNGSTALCFAGIVTNTAYVVADTACTTGNAVKAVDSGYTLTTPGVTVSISKTAIPAAPSNGGPVSYRIVVTNSSTVTVTDLKVVDTLPPQVSFVSEDHPVTVPATTFSQVGAVVSWMANGISIPPAGTFTVTVSGTTSLCYTGSVSNTAWVYAWNSCGSDQKTSPAYFALAAPALTLNVVKTVVPAAPENGGPVTYVISVQNTSQSTITSLTIVDTIAAAVSFTGENHSDDRLTGLTFGSAGSQYYWNGPVTLGPLATVTVMIEGTAALCTSGSVSNTAWVWATSACGTAKAQGVAGFMLAAQTASVNVQKTHAPASPGNNAAVTYAITIQNTGTGTITSIKVTDTLASAVTFGGEDHSVEPGLAFSLVGSILAWNGPVTISPNEVLTLTITGTTSLSFTGFVSNTAYVVAQTACSPTTGKGIDSGYTLTTPVIAISVQKDVIPANPGNGNPVQYRINLTNSSGATLTDVIIVDTLPAQFTYVGHEEPAGLTFVMNGAKVSWDGTGLSLAPNATFTVTVSGTTSLCYTGVVSNTAWGWAGCVFGSDQKTDPAYMTLTADLPTISVGKTVTPSNPMSGEPVTYAITVTNSSAATVTNLMIVDTLPSQFTYAAEDHSAAPGLAFNQVGSRLAWNGGVTLGPTQVLTVTITGTAALCYSGVATNTVWAMGSNACGSSQQKANAYFTMATPSLGITVQKTITPAAPGNGMPVEFRIDVVNSSLATVTNLVITDTLSAQVTYVGTQYPAGLSFAPSGQLMVWSGAVTLSPFQVLSVTVTGTTSMCFNGVVSNTAWAVASNVCGSAQDIDMKSFPLGTAPITITVNKTVAAQPTVGAPMTYFLTVNNNSPQATVTNIVVVDTLPALVVYAGEDHTDARLAGVAFNQTGARLSWTGALTLSPLTSFTITVTGTAPLCFTGGITNTVWAYATNACASNQASSAYTFSMNVPALAINVQKTAIPANPGNGNPVQYRLVVSNTSQATVESIAIADTVPAQFTFLVNEQDAGSGLIFQQSGALKGWYGNAGTGFPPLGPGQSLTVTLTGTTAACYTGWVSNTLWVYAANACSNTQQKSLTGFALAAPPLALNVTKTVTPAAPVNGGLMAYTITIQNTSTATVDNIAIVDTIPVQVTGVTGDASDPRLSGLVQGTTGAMLHWNGPITLGPLESVTVMIYGTAAPCYQGAVSNTVWVNGTNTCSSAQARSPLFFNLSPASIAVAIQKTASPAAPGNGGPVEYTLRFTNSGAATITSIALVDTLPAQVNYVSEDHTDPRLTGLTFVNSGGVLSWTGNLSLAPLESATVTIAGTTALCYSGSVTNTGWIYAANGCAFATQRATNIFSLLDPVISVNLTKTALSTAAAPAGSLSYRITLTNLGNATVTDLAISDTLPSQLVYASQESDAGLSFVPGNPLAWNATGIQLAPGQSLSATVTFTPNCSAPGVFTNTAWVHAFNSCKTAEDLATSNVNLLNPVPGLTVVKTANPVAPANGGPVTYSIMVTNTSGATLTDLDIVDTLPAQVFFSTQTSDPATLVWNGNNSGVIAWRATGISMAPGQSATVTISGVTQVCYSGVVTNTGYAEGWNACYAGAHAKARSNGVSYTLLGIPPTITGQKTATPASQSNGGALLYTISVTNSGLDTVTDIEIIDTLPSQFIMGSQSFEFGGTHTVTYQLWGPQQQWKGPIILGPGQTCTVFISGTVDGCASGQVWNRAVLWAKNNCGTDRKTVWAAPFDLTVPLRAIDIVKTTVPASPAPGSRFTYYIRVSNTGAATLTNLIVQDTIPAGINLTSIVENIDRDPGVGGSWALYGVGTAYRTWEISGMTLNPGQSVTALMECEADGCYTGSVMNTASADGWDNTCPANHARRSTTALPFTLTAPVPVVKIAKSWVNKATGTQNPYPGMGAAIRYTVTVWNDSDITPINIEVIDSLPAFSSGVVVASSSVFTNDWSMKSTNGPNGPIWTITRATNYWDSMGNPVATSGVLQPHEKFIYTVDVNISSSAVGAFPVENLVYATYNNAICTTSRLKSAVAGATLFIAPSSRLTVKIYNSAGEQVLAFAPALIGVLPTDQGMKLEMVTDPSCSSTVVGDPTTEPFSPDDDCLNDVLLITFPDLIIPTTGKPFAFTWKGTNEAGKLVANGNYEIVAEATDPQSGTTVVMTESVVLSAKHVEISAQVFNAAGENVAILASGYVDPDLVGLIRDIEVDPQPFEPTIDGLNKLKIYLLDKDGKKIFATDSAGNPVDSDLSTAEIDPVFLTWDGTSDKTGQIVNNGVYMVQFKAVDSKGNTVTITKALSVSHGKLDLISDVKAVPNPMARQTLYNDASARVWVRYSTPSAELAKVEVKVYNLAGELVWKDDVTGQTGGSDPLGKTPTAVDNGVPHGTFWWDGRNTNKTLVVPGMYIVVIEASDEKGNMQREVVKIALQ